MEIKDLYTLIIDISTKVGGIASTVSSMEEVHRENREDIKATLAQAIKTNGRVTNLEKTVENLAKVASSNSGLIRVNQDSLKDTNREVNELKKVVGRVSSDHNDETKDKRKLWYGIVTEACKTILTGLAAVVGTLWVVR